MKARYVVLLAGGVGSRLEPLSLPDFPKQFFRLPGETETLLQQAARVACELVSADCVVTVTTAAHIEHVRTQLEELSPNLLVHILVEEHAQGTATAATAAALYVQNVAPHALIWLLPCDNVHRMPQLLTSVAEAAFSAAEQGKVLTFGVPPVAADTGFGYLMIKSCSDAGFEVDYFLEKPEEEKARELVQTGKAWWNSGMFILPTGMLVERMKTLAPDVLHIAEQALWKARWKEGAVWLPLACAPDKPSLDKTVMEHIGEDLLMLPLTSGWSDIGTWERLVLWWRGHASHIREWDFGTGTSVLLEAEDGLFKVVADDEFIRLARRRAA